MIRRAGVAGICVVAVATITSGALAQDFGPGLHRSKRVYDSAASIRAEFNQIISNPMLGAPERSTGTMFIRKPDRFAMRFSAPAGDRIVSDGRWLWLYTPSTTPDQVIRRAVASTGSNSPNLFSQFLDTPRYKITDGGVDTLGGLTVDVWKMVPRESGMGFTEATLSVSRVDALIRRIVLLEESGQRRELVFTKIELNVAVPDSEVRFVPPRGVKVVNP